MITCIQHPSPKIYFLDFFMFYVMNYLVVGVSVSCKNLNLLHKILYHKFDKWVCTLIMCLYYDNSFIEKNNEPNFNDDHLNFLFNSQFHWFKAPNLAGEFPNQHPTKTNPTWKWEAEERENYELLRDAWVLFNIIVQSGCMWPMKALAIIYIPINKPVY